MRRRRTSTRDRQLTDLVQALGCGTGAHYHGEALRYERVIVMTDADVDGAHIASLLLTFFYREMPILITEGHLFLAVPPLYRMSHGGKIIYARDECDRDEILEKGISRQRQGRDLPLQGPGRNDAGPAQGDHHGPEKRTLLRVKMVEDERKNTDSSVERLMGNKPELRFEFIQERAEFAAEDVLDVYILGAAVIPRRGCKPGAQEIHNPFRHMF